MALIERGLHPIACNPVECSGKSFFAELRINKLDSHMALSPK